MFRVYDPALGRCPDSDREQVDPMADVMSSWTPYNYGFNSPIRFNDPLGDIAIQAAGTNSQNAAFETHGQRAERNAGSDNEKKKIAVDPGHGDHHSTNSQVDPGAVNGENYEKDIVLAISNALSSRLSDEGFTVTQTREGDVEDAGTRFKWRISNAGDSDIFVSIHNNASENPSANGFEVLYKKGDENSKALAESIRSSNCLFKDRGILEKSNVAVLNSFKGIAVLVEAGFISNEGDLKILKNQSLEVGNQIADGIINYLENNK